MGKLEKSVEDYLVGKIEELGGMALKGAVQGRRFLDRIIILPQGITIWCEVKRPGKSSYGITAHQGETLDRLDKMQHITWKIKNRDEVDALVKTLTLFAYAPPDATRQLVKSFCVASSQRGFAPTPRRSGAR